MTSDPSREEDLSVSSLEDLLERVRSICEDRETWKAAFGDEERTRMLSVIALLRPGCRCLLDLADDAMPFLLDDVSFEGDAVREHLRPPGAAGRLQALREAWGAVPAGHWAPDRLGDSLRKAAGAGGEEETDLAAAARVALLGKGAGPGPGEIAVLLGRERTLHRLDTALRFLGVEPSRGPALLRIR